MTRTCPHCRAAFAGDRRSRFCPDCRDTAAPWRVDDAALARACAHLGFTTPVRVRRMTGRALRGRYHGARLTPDAPRDMAIVERMTDAELNACMYHSITIAARLTPTMASRTLWHELTHAAQYERDPDRYVAEYRREQREARLASRRTGAPYAHTYRLISFETEATANELLHDELFALTLTNRRCTLAPVPDHPFVVAAEDGRLILSRRHADHERIGCERAIEARARLDDPT